jgi:DNA repair protein RAD51
MSTEEPEQSQSGYEDSGVAGPGAPTAVSALEGNGITARDIAAVVAQGYNTVESIAYT